MKGISLAIALVFFGCIAGSQTITNLGTLNSEYLEFCPIPYGGGLIFTSSRNGGRLLVCPSPNDRFTDLFFAERNGAQSFGEPVALQGKINGKYNDGAPTFTPDGQTMIFSRNSMSGKNAQGVLERKLYQARLRDGLWVDVEEIPALNLEDYATTHPALSPDGQWLFFVSDRPDPEAQGGTDIYVSKLENGQWSAPKNLGPAVNSAGNELFPYVDARGNLFFSSNGHGGLGGLDFYVARRDGEGWSLVGNLGEPFNSPADDVSISVAPSLSEGFLASDRAGGLGKDDLYHWTYDLTPLEATLVATDGQTGETLPEAQITLTAASYENPLAQLYSPWNPDEPQTLQTDSEGKVTVLVPRGARFDILTEKRGYQSDQRQADTETLTAEKEYRIPLHRTTLNLDGLVVLEGSNDPVPLAGITIVNKTTGVKHGLTADGEGSFRFELDCNHQYEITAFKDGHEDATRSLDNLLERCSEGEIREVLRLKQYVTLSLPKALFDFDRSDIRPDAAQALDKLVAILQKYPSMKIEVHAHTDSRGSAAYNEGLSQRRADSVRNYLLGKGIPAGRVPVAKGWGESRLLNHCADGVPCSREEHQQNRRAEIRIVFFDEPGKILKPAKG